MAPPGSQEKETKKLPERWRQETKASRQIMVQAENSGSDGNKRTYVL